MGSSKANTGKGRGRIDVLDSLRAFAAIIILITHFISGYGISFSFFGFDLNPWVGQFMEGRVSFSLFFVLSGFVLSAKYRMKDGLESHQPFSLLAFYIQRISRILPTFIFILLVSWGCHHFIGFKQDPHDLNSDWVQQLWSDSYTTGDVVKQGLLKPGLSGKRELIPQAWSLRATMKFILLTPFLIILATRSTKWLIVFTLIALGALKVEIYLLPFMLGVLIAKYREEIACAFKRWPRKLPLLGAFLIAWLFLVQDFGIAHSPTIKWVASGGLAACILIGAINLESWKRFLSWRPFRFTGRISYSIYLWHILVMLMFTPLIISALNSRGFDNITWVRIIALSANLAITYILSVCTFYLIEQPSGTLGKNLNALYLRGVASLNAPRKN